MQPNPLYGQIQATGINKTRGKAYGKAVRDVWALAPSGGLASSTLGDRIP
jgi:hypothetical protein